MTEEFIQYIWENRLFFAENLSTTDAQIVKILHTGNRNFDSGPDFFNARIIIGDTEWAGNVEVHRKASDWLKHNHTQDGAYQNVILHVVEKADKTILRENGSEIPVLELKYPDYLLENYNKLLESKSWIPCSKRFNTVDPFAIRIGFHSLMIERLEQKTRDIILRLKQNNENWNEALYQTLAGAFGFKVNSQPFEMLAKALPLSILVKHSDSLFQTEAMLFGCSGLLNNQLLGDDYFIELRNEFSHLYKKYSLKPIDAFLWKFMRLRPANFPTIRISQFAALVNQSNGLLSKIIETDNLNDLFRLFNVSASEYWNSHYNFNKESKTADRKELGANSVNALIINVVVPFLFVYGNSNERHYLKDRALDILEQLPPEENSVISGWEKLGIKPKSAFDSQALLQLKKHHCDFRKCLGCRIGVKLINNQSNE
jgi:hypothetical protein